MQTERRIAKCAVLAALVLLGGACTKIDAVRSDGSFGGGSFHHSRNHNGSDNRNHNDYRDYYSDDDYCGRDLPAVYR